MSVHITMSQGKHQRENSGLENTPLLSFDTAPSNVNTIPAADKASLVDTTVRVDPEPSTSHSAAKESLRVSPAGAQDVEAAVESNHAGSVEPDRVVGGLAGSSLEGVTIDDAEHEAIEMQNIVFQQQQPEDPALDDDETDEPVSAVLKVSFDDVEKDEIINTMFVKMIMGVNKAAQKETPLFWAIVEGNLRKVRRLLRGGAGVDDLDGAKNTPLHVAVAFGQLDILKYFLDTCDFQNTPSMKGFYPIHYAAYNGHLESAKLLIEKFGDTQLRYKTLDGSTVWLFVAFNPSANELEEYLLQVGFGHYFSLNLVNDVGQFPLYILAISGSEARVARLLHNGAALSVEGDQATAIKPIVSTFADPVKFFEEIFDECIYEENNELHVDFNILAEGMKQIKVLEDLANSGQSKILKHPVIESLIYLKWECLLPMFHVILGSYVTFLVALNTFVITTFYEWDTNNATLCSEPSDSPCGDGCRWYSWVSVAFIYISVTVLFTQEFACIYLRKRRYFVLSESWVKLFGLTLAVAVPAVVGCAGAGGGAPSPPQRHVACAALLLAWTQGMLLLARCPGWGYYLLMFERVAKNILKILVTSICLVIALSTCFMIYYQSKPPFDGPFAAFVKTLAMMSSEFDYEDLFGEDHDAQLVGTRTVVRILFVAFVILIAIVLMNFMVGVAVSDINELTAIGNIRRLEKQVELLSTVEGLVGTVLQRWFPSFSKLRYHSHMYNDVMSPGRIWILKYCDGETTRQYEQHFTKQLQDAIYGIAKKNKQKNLLKQNASETVTPHNSTFPGPGSILEIINKSNLEMKQSIDALKNDVDKILRVVVKGMGSGKVSSKTWPRKRKLKKKPMKTPSIND